MKENALLVRAVTHSLAILRHLAGSAPQGVNAIARAVELSPSSCFNILKTLVHENIVSFDTTTKRYTLETMPAYFFTEEARLRDGFQHLRQDMSALAGSHLVTCALWHLTADRMNLVEIYESPSPTRVHLASRQRLPAYLGATGRCVAGVEGRHKSEIAGIIGNLRWQSPPSVESYWQEGQKVRGGGWATDRDHYIRGLTTVAAPIRSSHGKVRYCLSAIAFSGQFDEAVFAEIGALLVEIADRTEGTLK